MDSAFIYRASAELYGLRGETDRMRAYNDSARVVLEGRLRTQPDEARFHSELGIAYARLGRREDAIHEGQTATRLLPVSKEALLGADWIRNLAQIYTMVGMRTEAVEQLETLLSLESSLSPHWLRLDPIWQPLSGHPDFQRLLTSGAPPN